MSDCDKCKNFELKVLTFTAFTRETDGCQWAVMHHGFREYGHLLVDTQPQAEATAIEMAMKHPSHYVIVVGPRGKWILYPGVGRQ